MAKKNAFLAKLQAAEARKRDAARDFAQQYSLDMTLITLHRMGWGKKRCAEFSAELGKTYEEYATITVRDSMDDKDVVYSKAIIDRALSFLEELAEPWEERYGFCNQKTR